MSKKIVETLNGEKHPADVCVQIKGDYYVIADPTKENTDANLCFPIAGKHYRLSAGSIIYDHRLKKYVLRTEVIVERGVIGFDDNFDPIFGAFSHPVDYPEEEQVLINHKKRDFLCICITVLQPLLDRDIWQERLSTGVFFKRTDLPIQEFNKITDCDQEYKRSLSYNSGDLLKKAVKIFNDKYKPKEWNKGLEQFPKIAKDYTFGLEFETIKGDIPYRITKPLGLIPLRDGSIDGIEFVTIPHSGKKGIQAILDSLNQLSKRTTYDKECSLHVHVGNLPRTEEFFVALTKVLCMIQEDVYNMFPYYTRGGLNLKKKDYTAPLPATTLLSQMPNKVTKDNIKEAFEPVFSFLSMGHSYKEFDSDLRHVTEHPSDPQGNSKWYVKSRYRWVNMIPLLFGNKQTVEFRIHTPTYSPDKVINYLVCCLAILDFAKTHTERINNGSIHPNQYSSIVDLVHTYLTQFGEKYYTLNDVMHRYWNKRKNFQKQCLLSGDFYANEDSFTNFSTFYTKKEDTSKDILTKKVKKLIYNDTSVVAASNNEISMPSFSGALNSYIREESVPTPTLSVYARASARARRSEIINTSAERRVSSGSNVFSTTSDRTTGL